MEADFVPGTVICHSPASSGCYIGSPSITMFPGGRLVVSHDFFGPQSNERVSGITRVYASEDGGLTWKFCSEVDRASHSRVFAHRGALYLLGGRCFRKSRFRHLPQWGKQLAMSLGAEDYPPNELLIRRSTDGGVTWTTPDDAQTGLLRVGGGGGAPTPPVVHDGKLWLVAGTLHCIDETADFLNAENWIRKVTPRFDPTWLGGQAGGYFEGGAVVTPDGRPASISKVRYYVPGDDRAALITLDNDAKRGQIDPERDFVRMPGARIKFSVRHDPVSDLYWSLTSFLPEEDYGPRTDLRRNTIALVCSPDLRTWQVQCILLHHPDTEKHGFQYPDFVFSGNDLLAVCRTAWPDDLGGPPRQHDANYLTFHRWTEFRTLTLDDSAPEAKRRLRKTIETLRQTQKKVIPLPSTQPP